jgi:hypothetical protein
MVNKKDIVEKGAEETRIVNMVKEKINVKKVVENLIANMGKVKVDVENVVEEEHIVNTIS